MNKVNAKDRTGPVLFDLDEGADTADVVDAPSPADAPPAT